MELELSAAGDLYVLPRPRGGSVTAAGSVLSAVVREMLMLNRTGKVAKKATRLTPGTAAAAEGRPATPARTRQQLARRVARRMLRRGAAPSRAVVLTCCCAQLPRGLQCALHQGGAPDRSWMALGEEAVEAPSRACGRSGLAFSEYTRWRRNVWMPSRFYLERVDRGEVRARMRVERARGITDTENCGSDRDAFVHSS